MFTRLLGRSGVPVSALGMGCWAIGGSLWSTDSQYPGPLSWGQVQDEESIRAIREALELGINLFDTADAYGTGHSEQVLGQAIAGHRQEVVIATKFGGVFEEGSGTWLGHSHPDGIVSAGYVRQACEQSLRRLNTDYIDLYQFHWPDYDAGLAADLVLVLEELVTAGKIRWYGWSTDLPDRAYAFGRGIHCAAVQHHYNLLERNVTMQLLCEEMGLAEIARGPLAMGLLTGKFTHDSAIPGDDVRHRWDLQHGPEGNQLDMLAAVHEILTQGGRTLAQGALGWLWARGKQIIPIPGFKTLEQVRENARALEFGPLTMAQMQEVDWVLGLAQDLRKFDLLLSRNAGRRAA